MAGPRLSFRSGPILFLEQLPAASFLLRYALSVCCSVQVGVLALRPAGSSGSSTSYWEVNNKFMMPE